MPNLTGVSYSSAVAIGTAQVVDDSLIEIRLQASVDCISSATGTLTLTGDIDLAGLGEGAAVGSGTLSTTDPVATLVGTAQARGAESALLFNPSSEVELTTAVCAGVAQHQAVEGAVLDSSSTEAEALAMPTLALEATSPLVEVSLPYPGAIQATCTVLVA